MSGEMASAWLALPDEALEILVRGLWECGREVGWLVAIASCAAVALAARTVLGLRARLEAVARAEHELRGPATALLLACERMRREPGTGRRHAWALEVELERLAAGLSALTVARSGAGRRRSVGAFRGERAGSRDLESFASNALEAWAPALRAAGRSTRFQWDAGRVGLPAQRAAIASALGNLVANAAEHGDGAVELRGSRLPEAVRVEIRNRARGESRRSGSGHGRGLAIAAGAAREAGGELTVRRTDRDFLAALELPLDWIDWPERPQGFRPDRSETDRSMDRGPRGPSQLRRPKPR